MANPVRIDHVATALGRLPAYLKDKQRWRELLAALVRPFQEIEDAALAIISQRHLDNSVGAQMDQLGALVKEPRGGLADADYARRIRARVAANRSQGLVEDLIRVARLIVYASGATITLEQNAPATILVHVGALPTDAAVAVDLVNFLKSSASAGVRVIVVYASALPAAAFTLDGAAGTGFPTPYTFHLADHTGNGHNTILGVTDTVFADGVRLTFVPGALRTYVDTWPNLTFTFVTGVTTIEDFEGSIVDSSWIFVASPSTTPSGTLVDPDDAFTAVAPTAPIAGGAFGTATE